MMNSSVSDGREADMQGLLPDDIPQPVADDIHASWRDGIQHSVFMGVGYNSVIP